jgi:hypothetical protein
VPRSLRFLQGAGADAARSCDVIDAKKLTTETQKRR